MTRNFTVGEAITTFVIQEQEKKEGDPKKRK